MQFFVGVGIVEKLNRDFEPVRLSKQQVLDNLVQGEVVCVYDKQTLSKIVIPVRSRKCSHLQCFDYKNFLNVCKPICPVCDKFVKLDEIFVDEFFAELLESNHDFFEILNDKSFSERKILSSQPFYKLDDVAFEHNLLDRVDSIVPIRQYKMRTYGEKRLIDFILTADQINSTGKSSVELFMNARTIFQPQAPVYSYFIPSHFSISLNGSMLNLEGSKINETSNGRIISRIENKRVVNLNHFLNLSPGAINQIEIAGRIYDAYLIEINLVTKISSTSDFISKLLKLDRNQVISELDSSHVVNLFDQASNSRIVIPARSRKCKHIQCFDLNEFIDRNINELCPTCMFCFNAIYAQDLVIDGFFEEMLALFPNNDFIQIDKDGSCKPATVFQPRNVSFKHSIFDDIIMLTPINYFTSSQIPFRLSFSLSKEQMRTSGKIFLFMSTSNVEQSPTLPSDPLTVSIDPKTMAFYLNSSFVSNVV